MVTLENLPEDIIIVILSMLPVKSVSRFRCVCKLWYELFKNPNFIKMHLKHAIQENKFTVLLDSYINDSYSWDTIDFDVTTSSSHRVTPGIPGDPWFLYDSVEDIIFSYDGLIGTLDEDEDQICLWNPLTREYRCISILDEKDSYNENFSVCGVSYDWKIYEYKLFKFVPITQFVIASEVWVSSLGSNSWNRIENIPYNTSLINICVKPLNGIIHWIDCTEVIVSFDIVREQTKEIQIPSCYLNSRRSIFDCVEVGFLGEDLFLSVNATCQIDLWVMKDYGVTDTWNKIFSLSKDKIKFSRLRPLHYLNKNREVLLQGVSIPGNDALVSYEPKSGRLVTLYIPCIPKHFGATTFVGSLVSLNSGEFLKATKEISTLDTSLVSLNSGEFVEATEEISNLDTSLGANKFLSLPDERPKFSCLELQRFGRATYFGFWLVLLCGYLALRILGSRTFLNLFT